MDAVLLARIQGSPPPRIRRVRPRAAVALVAPVGARVAGLVATRPQDASARAVVRVIDQDVRATFPRPRGYRVSCAGLRGISVVEISGVYTGNSRVYGMLELIVFVFIAVPTAVVRVYGAVVGVSGVPEPRV